MQGDAGREYGEGGSTNGSDLVYSGVGGQRTGRCGMATTREMILEAVDASEDERGVTLSSLQRGIERNTGVVRQMVERLVRDGVLAEERTKEEFGETRWLRRS
jgi:hypothetical protein